MSILIQTTFLTLFAPHFLPLSLFYLLHKIYHLAKMAHYLAQKKCAIIIGAFMQRSKFCSVGVISKVFERDFSMFYGMVIIVFASITHYPPYAVVTLISTLFTLDFLLKSLNKFGCFCSQIYSFFKFIISSKSPKSSRW